MKSLRSGPGHWVVVGTLVILNCLIQNAEAGAVAPKRVDQWENSLAPAGESRFTLTLTRGGRAALTILLPSESSEIEEKAAHLLKEALDKGTGGDFPIIKESDYVKGPVISLGQTALFDQSGLLPSSDLGKDGYSISEKGGTLFLTGGSRRGAISPVIALIEEDLGGRFYSRQEGLNMPTLSPRQMVVLREYTPTFTIRSMFQSESFDREFQLFNRVGSFTSKYDRVPEKWGGTTRLPEEFFVHTFVKLLPNEVYFDDHPEYFALIDGKRKPQGHSGGGEFCLTNPDVRRIVTDRVLDELKTFHSFGLFDVSPNDNTDPSFCECPNCAAIESREGSEAGPLIDFVNTVADEVFKVYPEVKITTLAYKQSRTPPKSLRPNKNVVVRLANDSVLFPYPIIYIEEDDGFIQNLEDWKKTGAQLMIWDYMANFRAWPMPRPNLEVIGRNIEVYAEYGLFGLFLQSSNYGVGENQGKLRAWLYSKKMWDPSIKTEDLIRDFNYGYFGKAGHLMQTYSELLSREWQGFHDSHDFDEKFGFSTDFYPKARSIFDEALELASECPELRAKIELEFVSILFFRLETMAPAGDADRMSYQADLEKFVELTERYDVEWISERETRTRQRIQEWRRKYAIGTGTPEEPVSLRFDRDNITLLGDGAAVVDDVYAPDGRAIKLLIQGESRSLQWFFGSALLDGVQYSVRVQIRAERTKAEGPAVGFGIVVTGVEEDALAGVIDSSDLADLGYSWVECGEVNGSDAPAAFFYISQVSDSSVRYVYVSAIEITPVQAEELKTEVE